MKKILMIAAVASAFAATTASAQAATYSVKANVTAFCTALTGSTTDLDFGTLTVGADGKLTGVYTKTSTQTPVVCNGANTTIAVTPTAMTNAATLTDTTNFTNTINYTTGVTLAGRTVVVDSTAHPIGELTGTLNVTASALAPAGGKALLAGNYAGTIVVTLAPAA